MDSELTLTLDEFSTPTNVAAEPSYGPVAGSASIRAPAFVTWINSPQSRPVVAHSANGAADVGGVLTPLRGGCAW
jgi:hypothetical protein